MNFDFGSLMQMMLASSLLSGKGFEMSNFMGNLTFDKLIGLQMLSNMNFNNVMPNSGVTLTPEQFEELKSLIGKKQ